ncbi:MAG: flagellar FlbD family protein [Alicyclobacillaceae bacterium]|nr:flagellar FlbD family protein [Alicyclobacillaceae bacterium]
MIALTRLNGSTVWVNAVLIESVEANPDTVVTLIGGRKIVVRETVQEVAEQATSYYRKIGLIGSIRRIRREGESHDG